MTGTSATTASRGEWLAHDGAARAHFFGPDGVTACRAFTRTQHDRPAPDLLACPSCARSQAEQAARDGAGAADRTSSLRAQRESFDARMGRILRHLLDLYPEGATSAEIAVALDLDFRECAAKLRSLVGDGVVESSVAFDGPARYWVDGPVVTAQRYLKALEGGGDEA